MINMMVNYLRRNTVSKLYNLGCSFAYGNCVPERNKLSEEHKGPGTYVAEYFWGNKNEEINLACNGNSLDGILRRLYTEEITRDNVILIGVPPASRFQIVNNHSEIIYNKVRAGKSSWGADSEAQNCIKHAFTKGPSRDNDWFLSYKWPEINDTKLVKKIDINETASYLLYFNLVKIQTKLKEIGAEYYIYNSVGFFHEPKNVETLKLKSMVDLSHYYQPDTDMFSLVKSDEKYELAEGDQHPNHIAYKEWSYNLCKWIEEKREGR